MAAILRRLMPRESGSPDADSGIGAVGHRVVHGGEEFTGSVLINDAVLASIEKTTH
jgi:acetate kinase